eukprot:TRINITY_DN54468_c0_g1_i1.p1 TRINITY_DN54468_c0_g1~~TRINITY_DN54468_c0_g1_i1.p1  ORF type:complete len:381 (-),score=45.65 TRINITY_DN54468_c0_g1_i1:249-1391(-)
MPGLVTPSLSSDCPDQDHGPSAMDAALTRDRLAAAVKKLTFGHNPWMVINEVLGSRWAATLATEAEALERASLLTPHTFTYGVQGKERQLFQHPGRRYVDLDPARAHPLTATIAPMLTRFAAQEVSRLVSRLKVTSPELAFTKNPLPHVKLQLTQGEHGCTPCHYDTSYSSPTSIQLSLLIYLSDPGWCLPWGGELQLLPFIGSPVFLEPTRDRAVLFLSDRMLHRSMPPRGLGVGRARWLLTVWLEGNNVDEHVPTGTFAPPLQRLLAPALHSAVYVEALTQSIPPGEARMSLLAEQQSDITAIETDSELIGLLNGLKELQAAERDALEDNETEEKEQEDEGTESGNDEHDEKDEERQIDPMDLLVAALEPSAKRQRCQ